MTARATVASDAFRGRAVDERAQPIPIAAWFSHCYDGDAELVEHTIALEAPRATLSLLWIPELAARGLSLDGESTEESAADAEPWFLRQR